MNQSCKISAPQSTIFSNFLFTGLLNLCMIGLLSPSVCSAQTWTGATNTDWNVNTNWSTNTIPTGATDVQIPNTANKPIIGNTTDAVAESVKILSGGKLTIEGKLALFPGSEDGIDNQGTVNNNGLLKIGSATPFTLSGIDNKGLFNNNGIIEIGKVATDGIKSTGTFNNSGSIEIGAVGTNGRYGINNTGTFSNEAEGNISVDHTTSDGVLNGAAGAFINGGMITIGGLPGSYHIASSGIHNKATFINSGSIDIDRCGGSSLNNESNTFKNTGTVRIAHNIAAGNVVIVNLAGATLTNEHCAYLEANGAFYNKGIINNLSLMKLDNATALFYQNFNTGTITNDGVIENFRGDPIPGNFINHDLVVKPVSGECILPNVLQRGNESSFNVAPVWYFDEDLSLQAGNYNQSGNTFLQGNLSFGDNRVFFLVQDNDYGCLSEVTMVITLLPDQTKPTVTCKQAVVEVSASGSGALDPALLMESAEDDCGGDVVPVSVTPNTFNCAQIGQSVYATLTVSDESGNTATCTATVTVKDVTQPTMICKPATINLNAAGQATLTVAQVDNGSYDNCAITVKALSQTNFSCANIGNNTISLGGNDASGNRGFCDAVVTVKDLIAPVAKCKNITANLASDGTVSVAATAVDNGSTDNCSLSLTLTPYAFNCGNVGVNNVTLKATDVSGNFSTCAATITVKDITAPNALCKNATVALNDLGQGTLSVNQLNNGSSDACGIATLTLSKTQFNCSDIPGSSQSVTLTLKDVNNNQSSCTAQVTTKDNLAPTAICQNTTVQLGANGTVTVYPADLAANSFDNCSVTSYSPTAKVYTKLNLGNNSLSITVKDWSGNGATCVSVVTVQPYNGFGGGGNRSEETSSNLTGDLGFKVYPNPTAGDATVDFEMIEDQSVVLRLYDLTGRMVLTQNLEGTKGSNQSRLEMATLPNGVYVVEIQAVDVRKQKRLVVHHD